MDEAVQIYRRSPDVVFRQILDEHILVPVRGQLADMQKVFALNPVAAAIWQALEVPHPLAAITAQVVNTFAVDEATAKADVAPFIAELLREGLIVVVPSTGNG